MILVTALFVALLAQTHSGSVAVKPLPVPPAMVDLKASCEGAAGGVSPMPAMAQEPDRGMMIPSGENVARRGTKGELPRGLAGARARIDRERLYYDRPGDGHLWVRGRGYKARFGPSGATYFPAFGPESPRNFPISFSVASASVGGRSIEFARKVDAARAGDAVSFDRGAFVERYDIVLDSMEQNFVFDALPGDGELVLEIDVTSELAIYQDSAGNVSFENEFGRVGYTSALIVDALGARIPVPTHASGTRIELRASHALLAGCVFPITIDPVITTFDLDTSTAPTFNPDVAYDVTNDRFMVIWETSFTLTDWDVWSEFWSADGVYLGEGEWIDFTSDTWNEPAIANNNLADTFLVVAHEGPLSSSQISGRIRSAASPGIMGAQFRVDAAGAGARYNPSIGGDSGLTGPTFFFVAYEREFSTGDHDIHGQLLSADGVPFGSTILIDSSASTLDRRVRVSRSSGAEPWQTQRWNVVWNRRMSIQDEDVYSAQVDWDGTVVTPSFLVFDSVAREWRPTVSAPLDERGNGERPYLIAFAQETHPDGSDWDVVRGALMEGGTRMSLLNLTELENINVGLPRTWPAVGSDGRTFVVASSERFVDDDLDYDLYISTYTMTGSTLQCVEAHERLAFSVDLEYDPRLASTYSGGGARQRYMGVWTDLELENGALEYDVEGGVYDSPVPPVGVPYCTAITNSTGQQGRLSAQGSSSVAAQDITLLATGLPAFVPGLFYFGNNAIQTPFGDGFRCVGGQTHRMYPFVHSDGSGLVTREVNWSNNYASSIVAGDLYWQLWYRDGAGGLTGFNLTDGLHMTLFP